jgi:hypothetical protein
MFVPPDSLLSIAEAARELNLSEQRIHQLLSSRDLDGVELPQGRKRHSPGSPRVYATSVARLIRERQNEQDVTEVARRSRQSPSDDTAGQDDAAASPRGASANEMNSTRAAALAMKVRLDAARDQVRKERDRTKKALDIAASLLDLLRDSTQAGDDLDDIADGYADALTQVLTPHQAPD